MCTDPVFIWVFADKLEQQQQQVLPDPTVGGRPETSVQCVAAVGAGGGEGTEQPGHLRPRPGGGQRDLHQEVCTDLSLKSVSMSGSVRGLEKP